jgi:NitT/TauT family transport system substrate-binding protein
MIDRAGGQEGVDEMVKLIHNYVYTDRPLDKAAPSIINGTMRINEGARLNIASVRDQLEWFQAQGLVDESITLDMLVDTSYVETFQA